MSDSGWSEYFNNTKDKPARPLLVKALPYVEHREVAIDLGSGALNDSIFLLREGFRKVIALDREPVAEEIAVTLPHERFEYVISPLETFDFPVTFDLVNAQYSLPFINPEQFESVFYKIISALNDSGIFVGQFFGDRDGWTLNDKMTFHSKEQVAKLLSGYEIILLEEKENDRPTASGNMKHWHVFDFIIRK
jgi:tellurite methyltransferase